MLIGQGQSVSDWITLGVAVTGVGLASLSLFLQRRALRAQQDQFRDSGSVVKVDLRAVVVGTEPLTDGISVSARNVGRLGVEVTGWGAILPNGKALIQVRPLPGNGPMPHRLEAGSRGSWWMPLSVVQNALKDEAIAESDIAMFVDLATGDHLVTGDSMRVGPSA